MLIPKRRPVRPTTPTVAPPGLILLPALHPGADTRPALLPAQPCQVPRMFPTMAAALTELRRLQGDRA